MTGKLANAAWRRSRAARAGRQARQTYAARRQAVGARFATKGDAYAAGYRAGYQRAYAWWQHRLRRIA